ncbi:unnamed protein product [Nezara viridula]|uniref:Uncharacterized protein n=1 Tax=Nezara viridula TaxID=85310 RepID=A0A9P0H3U6_NEZVI|nr:unnamed protein product [Nezara viridula]
MAIFRFLEAGGYSDWLLKSLCFQILKRTIWEEVEVSFNNSPLIPVKQIRYLGLHLDKRLTLNPHIRLKRLETARCFRLIQH